MSMITLELPAETEKKLRERASQSGLTVEGYLQLLAERATEGTSSDSQGRLEPMPRFVSEPRPTDAEFQRLLNELASPSTGHVLPPDFSRADIYDDHD
jgi:hypothetical protein